MKDLDVDLSLNRVTIQPRQPYSFRQSLAFLRGFTPCSGDNLCSTDTLTTGGYAAGLPFVAEVTEDDALVLDIEWLEEAGDPAVVGTWLTEFLSLDDDLVPLYRAADDDPVFMKVVDALYGYHHVRFPSPFEAACWAALSQRTPWNLAETQKQGIVEACGRVVEVDAGEIELFPTSTMVRDNSSAVHDAVGHDRKSKTILSAADTFATQDLAELNDQALRERLKDVWGFGEWSSEFIALRGFGRLSALPRKERRLREAVAELYDLEKDEASDEDLDRLSEPYRPQQGYWAHYIRVWAHRESG